MHHEIKTISQLGDFLGMVGLEMPEEIFDDIINLIRISS